MFTVSLDASVQGHVHGPGYEKALEQTAELAVPCPVMSHKQADGRYHHVYEGQTYYFCCSDCVEDFKADPEQYIEASGTAARGISRRENVWETLAGIFRNQVTFMGIACSLLIVLLALIYWRARKRAPTLLFHAAWLPLFAALFALVRQGHLPDREIEERLLLDQAKEYFNYAVPYDFGSPPVPARPSIPPRLRGTYYRGNDERTGQLWNNGHYRTSSFELRLERANGVAVDHEAQVSAEELHVQMDIVRAPFTTEAFWSPAVMSTIFLTREANPLDRPGANNDRVWLTTVEPRQRFTAGYPVGTVKGTGTERLQGLVYVCEKMVHRGIRGARYHLAIQYDILIQDGVIQSVSDLWMGALYRTRRVSPWQLPLHEWFSHLPIPELPEANSTTDPTALGTADYQHIIEGGKNESRHASPPKQGN